MKNKKGLLGVSQSLFIIIIEIGALSFMIIAMMGSLSNSLSTSNSTAIINETNRDITSFFSNTPTFMAIIAVVVILLAMSIVMSIVIGTVCGFPDAIDGTSNGNNTPKPREPEHKQTYLEYVKEMKEAQEIIDG